MLASFSGLMHSEKTEYSFFEFNCETEMGYIVSKTDETDILVFGPYCLFHLYSPLMGAPAPLRSKFKS